MEDILRVISAAGARIGSTERRNLARNLFPAFYERGYSANRALQLLREAGLGYRRQDFLRDFAEGEQRYRQAYRVRFVREDRVPTERILQSRYHGVPDKYSFTFRVSLRNEFTGKVEYDYFMLHTDVLRTRSALEDIALEYYRAHYPVPEGFRLERIQAWEGYVNPIWTAA
jgi:hypothetical protein